MPKHRQSQSFGHVARLANSARYEPETQTHDIDLETRVTNLENTLQQVLLILNDMSERLDKPKPKPKPKQKHQNVCIEEIYQIENL